MQQLHFRELTACSDLGDAERLVAALLRRIIEAIGEKLPVYVGQEPAVQQTGVPGIWLVGGHFSVTDTGVPGIHDSTRKEKP